MPGLLLNHVELQFIESLLDAGVRFVIVGGYAVRFHGHVRPVEDLDIFMEYSAENASRFATALSSLKAISSDKIAEAKTAVAKPDQQVQMTLYGNRIDVLTSLWFRTPICFQAAFQDAHWCFEKSINIPVLSYNHLIESKRARGEAKDLEDIAALKPGSS